MNRSEVLAWARKQRGKPYWTDAELAQLARFGAGPMTPWLMALDKLGKLAKCDTCTWYRLAAPDDQARLLAEHTAEVHGTTTV
jgi:hypothetical protein